MDLKQKAWQLLIQALLKYGGETVKNAVLWHLEHVYKINEINYLNNPERLIEALYSIYGRAFMMIERDWCYELKGNGLSCENDVANALKALKVCDHNR